ncbi:MAG: hypothetical protein KGL73_11425 [Burkholderiales bacterium]|nr:hypothetical protein [Burkholderiales bacterium]
MLLPAPTPMAMPVARAVRSWWRFHPLTLCIGLLLQLHLGYLLCVDQLNPAPEPEQLVQIPVEVLRVQDRVPHLRVRLADETQQAMEFPVSAALLATARTPLDEAGERDSLPGCMGYVLGVPVRWVRDERFRIWELHCGPVHRVYAEFKAGFEAAARDAQRAMEWHGAVILLLTIVVLVLEHRALRRRGLA